MATAARAIEGLGAPRYRRPAPGSQGFNRADPWIFIGTRAGLDRSRAKRGSLVAPLDADPATFRWPVEDLAVMLIADGASKDQAMPLIAALLRDGASLIVAIGPSGDKLPRWMHTAHGHIQAQEIER
jgi:hypothetical protein